MTDQASCCGLNSRRSAVVPPPKLPTRSLSTVNCAISAVELKRTEENCSISVHYTRFGDKRRRKRAD